MVKRFTIARSSDFARLEIVKCFTIAGSNDFAGLAMVKRFTIGARSTEARIRRPREA